MGFDRPQASVLPPAENGTARKLYLRREPASLAVLLLLSIVSFLAVGGLSRAYHAQQKSLGDRWYARGVADLQGQRFDRAVNEFRTALRYDRDDYSYQLNLAEALIGQKRAGEASAYLLNLWEREPENGQVNLELARIAASNRQTDQVLRYYHNAIYATWPGDEEVQRREARLELIQYLLAIHSKEQAQSELIALAANLNGDPAEHLRAAELFFQTQDYEHALAEYRASLRLDRHNAVALAGAGQAAFELGRYEIARRYLQSAVAADSSDSQSATLLKTTESVIQLDPFQSRLSSKARNRVVIEAFSIAGDRLSACPSLKTTAQGHDGPFLSDRWEKLKNRINEPWLRRDPDLAGEAMDLVFSIERQAAAACGPPTGKDQALLLISKLHEGI